MSAPMMPAGEKTGAAVSVIADGRSHRGVFDRGTTVLEVLRKLGVPVDAACSGAGTCGKCRVIVRAATDATGASVTSGPSDGSGGLSGAQEVLACQTVIDGDMTVLCSRPSTISVPSGTHIAAMPMVTGVPGRYGCAIDVGTTTLACRLVDLANGHTLAQTTMGNPQILYGADVASRISAASEGDMYSLSALIGEAIDALVREAFEVAGKDVPAAFDAADTVVDEDEPAAFDAADTVADEGTSATLETVGGVAAGNTDMAAIGNTDMVIVGNTVMESIVAGIDPSPIGIAPFFPSDFLGRCFDIPGGAGKGGAAGKSGKGGAAGKSAYLAPAISGYIGGDITADIVACGMTGIVDTPTLLLDLGTNGEMVLAHDGRIMCCATAAGPSFEGAQMTMGMNAAAGAIASAHLREHGFDVEVIGSGEPIGICGTGYIDTIAELLRCGILDGNGLLAMEGSDAMDRLPAAWQALLGREDGIRVVYLTDDRSMYITQKDIRDFQLGKAAVATGVKMLLDTCGITFDEVGTFYIAGGFGRYLDLKNAAAVGMIPGELLEVAHAVGNVAIEGATMALLDGDGGDIRRAMEDLRQHAEVVELSLQPGFNARFMGALGFLEGRSISNM